MAPPGKDKDKEAKEGRGQGGVGPNRTRGSFIYRGEFRQNSESSVSSKAKQSNRQLIDNPHPFGWISVENMMYAFGDVQQPDTDSVALLEDMTVSFLVDLCHRARPNPTKLAGIPSNQATINTIAAGLFSKDSESSFSTTNNNDEMTSRKGGSSARNAKAIAGSSTSMPPRIAPHPYIARPKMTVEDLKFACRKDVKLSSRIEELIYLDKIFDAARKAFNNPEEDPDEI